MAKPRHRLEPWLPGSRMKKYLLSFSFLKNEKRSLDLPRTHRMREFPKTGSRLRRWAAGNDETTLLLFLII